MPRFRGYQQQDAHEFLTYMLDRLHTELLQLLPRLGHEPLGLRGKQSIVTAVFGGTLLSVVSSRIMNYQRRRRREKKTARNRTLPIALPHSYRTDLFLIRWPEFPCAGPLHELPDGLEDARTFPRSLTGHSRQTAEASQGTGGGLQSNVQYLEILQSRGTGRQRVVLLRQLHGKAALDQEVLDTQAA